jgi:hypothetical protein
MAVSGRPDKPAAALREVRHADVKTPASLALTTVAIDFMKKSGVAS